MAATTTNTTNSAGGVVGVAPTGVEAYEDMFKEITRKLYGEETGHGLHTLGTPIAHVATTGPTVPEGERSFTTLISDRAGNTIDFTNDMNQNANSECSANLTDDKQLTTYSLSLLQRIISLDWPRSCRMDFRSLRVRY